MTPKRLQKHSPRRPKTEPIGARVAPERLSFFGRSGGSWHFLAPRPGEGCADSRGGFLGSPGGAQGFLGGSPGSRKRSRNKRETPPGARGAPDAPPGVDLDPLWAPFWVDLGVKFASISGYFLIDFGRKFGKQTCHTPRHAFVLTQRLRETTDSYWGDR